MKFKDNYYRQMLERSGVDTKGLAEALEESGIFEGDTFVDYYGCELCEWIDDADRWGRFWSVVRDFLDDEPDVLQRTYIEHLVLFGDGPCPKCGCPEVESHDRGEFDEDYNGSHDWIHDHWEHRCKCCGYEWETDEELDY